MQFVQPALPAAVLYVPASHAVHVPPFAPVYPMLHMQLVTAVLPAAEPELPGQLKHAVLSTAETVAEYWPARQLMQVLAPKVLEYLPAAQLMQFEADAPEYFPASHHMHAEADAVENFPSAHRLHVELPVEENFPDMQFEQNDIPTESAYFPGEHFSQFSS